jgi:putative membrane protein
MPGPPVSRKYRIVALGGLLGVALLLLIAARSRTAEVLTILSTGGGWALMAASLYRIVPVELNAAAWAALLEKRPLGWATTLWMRWIGEAVNSLLPAAQIGGDFARARLLTAGGVPAGEATAAMVADVAVGAFTQVLFTFLGAAALILGAPSEAPARAHLGWLALVIGIGGGFAALLIVVARVGVGRLLTALPLHLHGRLAARLKTGGAAIDRSLRSIWRRPGALLASATWHLAAWLAQVVETWLVLRLLGRPIGWMAALAFVVPGGIGVQEGALVAVGAAFGVPAPAALALAVIKRGRELVVGAPAIVAWVIGERHSIATFWSRRTMKERRRVERAVTSPSLTIMGRAPRLRVGVLVDLYWSPTAGGHVKTWERLAAAATEAGDEIDLTIHFLGQRSAMHELGPHVRYQIHPPLVSSARLPFLSEMPAHTDLAPHNPLLTPRLRGYDVIHTTDGTFASARTAARVSRWHRIPLTNSVHTTTPYYTRVFTAAAVQRLVGSGRLSRLLLDRWDVAKAAEAHMQQLLDDHHRRCAFVLASRADDRARLADMLGSERVGLLRRGMERDVFNPGRRDRAWLSTTFGIPPDRRVVISVGRLDAIKNVLVLAHAVRQLVDQGLDLHLFCAGEGADRDVVTALLGDRITCPGVLAPDTLARAYASADVCAQPAVVEELSNAVLEATSSGLPLVVAAGSGSERFVVEGQTGLVSREATPEAWAEALADLLRDPERAAVMGRDAHAWSLQHTPSWHEVFANDLLPAWRAAAAHHHVAAERAA